ncbi:hypothetical protein U9330_22950, partial [Escherichia coli]
WNDWVISRRQKRKRHITLPSEMVVWQPEFTDKTLSRKTGAVQSSTMKKIGELKLLPGKKNMGNWLLKRSLNMAGKKNRLCTCPYYPGTAN